MQVTDKDGKAHTVPDPVVFLYGAIHGVYGCIFADFGPKHYVFDPDGTPEKQIVIDDITRAAKGAVTIDGDRCALPLLR